MAVGEVVPDLTEKMDFTRQKAFSQFFEETHLQVYRYLYGLIGGPAEDVEDLVAETYSRAWTAAQRFNGDRQAATRWVFTIAKRKAIDVYRKREARQGQISIDALPIPSPGRLPEEQAVSNQQSDMLWEMMQGLPDETREILVLRYLLDWKVGQIAGYLGKKDTAVSMAIRRALRKLHDEWPESQ